MKINPIYFLKILKSFFRSFIKIIFRIFALISVTNYRLFYVKKNINYTTPTVQTFGDTLRHYQLIYLLHSTYKKKYHIISLYKEPCKTFLPFFFDNKYYSFYNEFIYVFLRKNFSRISKLSGIIKEFDDQILTYLIKYNSTLKYYKSNYSLNKDAVYKRLKDKFCDEYLKKYLYERKFNNKFQSLHKIKLLKKKNDIDFKKLTDQSEYQTLKDNLKINSKYICLHLRYMDENDLRKDVRSINNLESYTDLVKFIISDGYQVIVMGSNDDKFKLKLENKEIIYYKDTVLQNPKNDLLLIANCDFYIGNNSGPMTAAEIFKKNTIIFDFFPLGWMTFVDNRIYHNKKILNLNSNKILKNSEIIKDSIFFDASFEELKKKNFMPMELTSLEKLNLVKDSLKKFKNSEFSNVFNKTLEGEKHLDRFFKKRLTI